MRVLELDIARPGMPPTLVGTAVLDESTEYRCEFMGMDKIVVVIQRPAPLAFQVGDYIEYNGERYTIKHLSGMIRDGDGYRYEITFYSSMFDWYDKLVMHLGTTEFSYTGTPFQFASLLLDNMQSFDPSWELGDISLIDEPLTLPFSNDSCYAGLFQVVQEFGLEFRREGKTIHITEGVGSSLPITVEYGRGKGLYTLNRQGLEESFSTEWYGFGGTQNIPEGYRSGIGRLALSGPVERNVSTYGRKQGAITFDYIYPRFTGEVESAPDANTIIDSSIDFDIDPISDGSAKIVFKTGPLGGNEFTITGWDNATNKVTFGVNREESGYTLPNDTVHAEVGDKYTIIGIYMPSAYVSAAESELMAEVEDHADNNSRPKAAYSLELDEKYIRDMELEADIKPGDSIRVKDTKIGLDARLKVQDVSWPLCNPGSVTVTIAEVLLYTYQELVAREARTARKEASRAQIGAIYARRVADEIANAAILHQFERTYVGDRAVLTGAFVAGNPEDGEVAGINGTESGLDKVRFWAGSSFENRANAPFRVLQNGNIYSTAGYIGGFKILPGSLESANQYGGSGKFVLYPDSGFIAFIDDTNGVWAGIGINTLSAAFGIRAVGRFENLESNPLGTNYAMLAAAQNGAYNVALSATGNIAVRGAITHTNLYLFTPTSSNNTLSIKTSNSAIVLINNASYDTVYLPSVSDIQSSLGIGASSDFCIRYTVTIHYNSLNSLIAAPYDMRDHNGEIISSTEQNKGDCTEWFIFRQSGTVTAQLIHRQAS